MQRRPQVDHVSLLAAAASKQWKTFSSRFTLKVRPRPSPRWIGQAQRRCGPLPRSRAVRPRWSKTPRHRQLGFEMGEVEEHLLASRWTVRYSVRTGRGDHFPRRLVRLVARGLCLRGGWSRGLARQLLDACRRLVDLRRPCPTGSAWGRTACRSSRWRTPGAAACAWRGRWRWPCARGAWPPPARTSARTAGLHCTRTRAAIHR